MSIFSSPLPRSGMPRTHLSSNQRSLRDSDATGKLWQKGGAWSSQISSLTKGVGKLNNDVRKLKRRIVGGTPAPAGVVEMFPFKIYNFQNNLLTTNNWRTFQMRDGIISARSRFTLGGGSPFSIFVYYCGTGIPASGNFETYFRIPCDGSYPDQFSTPPIVSVPNGASPAGQITIANATDTQIFGRDSIGTGVGVYDQYLLSPELDSDTSVTATFWLEIFDSASFGFTVNLWSRMVSIEGTAGRPLTPFPVASPKIIPLAIVQAYSSGFNQVQQLITGNLVNRYINSQDDILQQTTERGKWTADSLSGQVFYDGDLVIDDSITASQSLVSPAGSFTYNKIYKYKGGGNIETVPPHTGGATKWTYVGVYI